MSRSSRRVLPTSSPSAENLRLAVPSPDRSTSSRLASRLGFAGSNHGDPELKEPTLPGGLVDAGRDSPTARRGSVIAPRRNSMRRAPIQSVFPESYEQRTASGTLRGQTDDGPPRVSLLRLSSLNEVVDEEYSIKLRVLFDICDGNSDGELTHDELLMLLRLLGMSELDTIKTYAPATIAPTSFGILIQEYRVALAMCAARYSLPRDDFVLRCKRLKHGFRKIDGDRDHGMTRAELEIATQKLDLAFSDDDLDRIFAVLDRDHDGSVQWCDFVYSAYLNTLAPVLAELETHFTIDMFADLPSFIRQVTSGMTAPGSPESGEATKTTPLRIVGRMSSNRLISFISSRKPSFADRSSQGTSQGHRESATKSAIERIGMHYLTRTSMEHIAQSKREIGASRRFDTEGSAVIAPGSAAARRANSVRTGFSVHVRRRIRLIEAAAVLIGSLTGILCGLISVGFESLLDEDHSNLYYFYVVLINIAVSVVEVHGMYLTAVIAAFRLTVTTNLKLYPQDAEREFLTRAIARAALQVGHRKHKLFGIDPMKDSPRLVLCMSFMLYKTKRYALKLLLKVLIKRVLWRAAAKSVLSLLVLPINGIMNAWTIKNVMLNCRVSIIGPPCVVSLLEGFFLQDDLILPSQRVDYVRVLGVSLVCKRSIHPNVEIMIEHMRRQWLKPDLWPVADGCICLNLTDEPCPLHLLDDLEQLLAILKLYASQTHGPAGPSVAQHRRNIFFFFIVALIIDGSVDWIERSLFVRVCNAAGVQNTWRGVLTIKDDFIAGKGIHTNAVMALVQEAPADKRGQGPEDRVPWRESALYSAQRIAQLLVW